MFILETFFLMGMNLSLIHIWRSELEIDKILRVVAVAVRAEKEHDGDQDEIDGVAQDLSLIHI